MSENFASNQPVYIDQFYVTNKQVDGWMRDIRQNYQTGNEDKHVRKMVSGTMQRCPVSMKTEKCSLHATLNMQCSLNTWCGANGGRVPPVLKRRVHESQQGTKVQVQAVSPTASETGNAKCLRHGRGVWCSYGT